MDKRFTTFLAVARAGSITEAARRLHITQPTLTKRLQLLEESLGCKLVERLPRGVRLTGPRAAAFLPLRPSAMQNDHFQGLEAVRAVRSGHLSDLRVGAGPLFHLRFLGGVFRRLRETPSGYDPAAVRGLQLAHSAATAGRAASTCPLARGRPRPRRGGWLSTRS